MKRGTRQQRRALDAVQPRWGRIANKVRRLSVLDGSQLHTPEELIAEMQKQAERLHREGALRADELRDLKRLHTLQLKQLAEAAIERQKQREQHEKAMRAPKMR